MLVLIIKMEPSTPISTSCQNHQYKTLHKTSLSHGSLACKLTAIIVLSICNITVHAISTAPSCWPCSTLNHHNNPL